MKLKNAAAVAMATLMLAPSCVFASDVYIAGDSTACEYGEDEKYALPRGGWGMYLDEFMADGVNVVNCAKSGRSSKSLVVEDEYKKIFDNIKEGDYLLIQFGHNDAKNTKPEDIELRYTEPEGDKDTAGSFKNSLYVNYIKPALDKGAKPVLLTPISRRKFDEGGRITDSHGRYDDAIRELAEELNILCIDMTEVTSVLYDSYGENGTKLFHAVFADTSKGIDNTHLNRVGAEYVASLVADEAMKYDADGLGSLVDESALIADQKYITRGEFTADIVRMLAIDTKAEDNFADVKTDDVNYEAIAVAKAAGIVNGNEKGQFMSDELLTLQDMYVITARALEYKGVLKVQESDSAEGCFNNLSPYAKAGAATLMDAGMLDNLRLMSSLVDGKRNVSGFDTVPMLVSAYEKNVEAQQAATEEISLDELEKVE